MFKEDRIWPGKLSLWNLLCEKQHGRKSKTWLWFHEEKLWWAVLKEIGPLGCQKAAKWKAWRLGIVSPHSAVQTHQSSWHEGRGAVPGTRPKSRSGGGLEWGVDAQPCGWELRSSLPALQQAHHFGQIDCQFWSLTDLDELGAEKFCSHHLGEEIPCQNRTATES